MTPDREPSDVYIDTQAKRMDALRLKPHEPDDYGDLLQRQEPLTEEEIIRGYSADPSELGSISTTEGLEQQTELDEETNPRLFK